MEIEESPKRGPMPPWYALDHAAIIYPAVISDRITVFFRLQATLDRPVNIEILSKAMANIAKRFPHYHVELRRGLFWYYLEKNPEPQQPIADSRYPMQKPGVGRRGVHLYRVRAYHDRIALEVCHIITDGSGGLILLKTLLGEYFRLQGVDVAYVDGVLDPESEPPEDEWEDAFAKYSMPGYPPPPHEVKAYHIPGTHLPIRTNRIVTGYLSVKELLDASRKHGASATEYLSAHYVAALQDIQDADPTQRNRRRRRPIKFEIPANMRKIFPTNTMRNFSLFMMPFVDTRLGHWKFEEILHTVKHSMALQLRPKELLKTITRNVQAARSIFIRALPLPLKNAFMRMLYSALGESLFSGLLTNLGPAGIPEPIASRVRKVEVLVTPSPFMKTTAAMVSHGDVAAISFGSNIVETDLERIFFRRLVKAGLHVKIESNVSSHDERKEG